MLEKSVLLEAMKNAMCYFFCLCWATAMAGLSGCATTPQTITPPTKQVQSAMTPDQALAYLKAGNQRFAQGQTLRRDWPAQVRQVAPGQFPVAAILSCMDSRTTAEQVFDSGVGDMLNVRVTANVLNEDNLGSLEFGAKVVGVKLIVVLGHTDCGGIKGVLKGAKFGHATEMLAKLQPALDAVPASQGPRDWQNRAFVDAATAANIRMILRQIRDQSPLLNEMVANGTLGLVGAMYDVQSGKVEFYRP